MTSDRGHRAGGSEITKQAEVTTTSSSFEGEFDYSSPEAEAAIRAAMALVLEIRDFTTSPLARKVKIYERTLGLAVIPVLLRRAIFAAKRRGTLRRRRR